MTLLELRAGLECEATNAQPLDNPSFHHSPRHSNMSNPAPSPKSLANLQETLALVEGNEAVLQALLTTFLTDLESKCPQLQMALAQQDAKTLGELSHSIKSSAAIFFAAPTVDAALKVETAWRNGDEAIFSDVAPLLASLDRLAAYLRLFVAKQ